MVVLLMSVYIKKIVKKFIPTGYYKIEDVYSNKLCYCSCNFLKRIEVFSVVVFVLNVTCIVQSSANLSTLL